MVVLLITIPGVLVLWRGLCNNGFFVMKKTIFSVDETIQYGGQAFAWGLEFGVAGLKVSAQKVLCARRCIAS